MKLKDKHFSTELSSLPPFFPFFVSVHCFFCQKAAADIGLFINASFTEYICYNWQGSISAIIQNPLKSVDFFVCLENNITFREKRIKIYIAKVWCVLNEIDTIVPDYCLDTYQKLGGNACYGLFRVTNGNFFVITEVIRETDTSISSGCALRIKQEFISDRLQ